MSSTNCLITGLRYIGLGVENFEECVEFYTKLWGLDAIENKDGVAYLASPRDSAAYLLRLRQAGTKRLDVIGLAAGSQADIDTLSVRLKSGGVQIDHEPRQLQSLGGGYGLRFFDCDGRLVEVSADVATQKVGNAPVPAGPINLSHVVVNCTNIAPAREFYQTHLGLKISDRLEDRMVFLRCASPKHHILALATGPHVSLNHVAYDVGDIDSQMRATGRLKRADRKLIWGPGRHFIGNNTFSYFIDPAGNVCEFTSELEEVDETNWQPRTIGMAPEFQDQWGTGGLVTDGMIPAQFNSPDKGLWQTVPV